MPARNLYFGIDLGTTNSVAAWGQENKDGKFIAKAVELRVLDEKQNPTKEKMLPSCVYYKKGVPPIVGAYARRMLSTQSQRVIKSVKSSMGTDRKYNIDGQEITPAEVSSLILKQVAISSREFNLGTIPNDAIITVPASFDPDQRADTNEAARLAGFLTDRSILLNEPTAALYDFLNRQDNGEIPEVVDLSEQKTILVFDIGGGTLDVSLHEVAQSMQSTGLPYDIRPVAISRHTLLGGDNFDELLQRFLIDRCIKFDVESLGEVGAAIFRSDVLDAAEKAKIELNSRVENYRMQGIDDYDSMNITCEILRPYIGNTEYGLDYELTINGYREIMKPYLAPDLTIESLDHMEALSHNTNNIIYPILDVLDKARAKLGTLPKIDAVLLNGGMSKLFAVRERIRDFFGFAPLEVGDPDLAVARGASVYHYWRQKGLKTPEIQNDDIGIAIQGGGLQKLITAGKVLPFTTEIYAFEIPEDGAAKIDLPFYKGTRSDTLPPNRRIATRRIRFTSPQKAGTPVQLQGVIDEAGTMTLKVWRDSEPETLYTVDNVHTDLTEKLLPPLFAVSVGAFKQKIPTGKKLPQSGSPKDIADLMRQYDEVSMDYSESTTHRKNAQCMYRMKELEAAILKAANCGEAIDGMAKILNMWRRGSDRAALMLGRIARKSSQADAQRAAQHLVNACSPQLLAENISKGNQQRSKLRVQGTAILALSTLKRPQDEGLFIELLRMRPFPVKYLTQELCYGLGRCGRSPDAVRELSECAGNTSAADRIAAYWGLGHVASRERPDKCPASVLEEVLPKILRCVESEQHKGALVNGVYALGEMCDQRSPTERVSQAFALKADGLLEKLYLHSGSLTHQTTKFIHIARSMIRGAALTSEDREILLKLREKDD